MKLFIPRSLLFVVLIFLASCSISPINSLKTDKDILEKPNEQGYLVFAVSTDLGLSSIQLKSRSSFELNDFLWLEDRNYVFALLPKGSYTVSRVNIGPYRHYDLDFDEISFSFDVAANKINYAGELRIKNGAGGFASFELINRSSLALEFLESKFPNILASKELVYQGPGKDEFFNLALGRRLSTIEENVK